MHRILTVLLILPWIAPATAQEPPPVSAGTIHEMWYGYHLQGDRLGWGVDRRKIDTVDGRPVEMQEVQYEFKVHAFGVDMATRGRERMIFDRESGRMLSASRVFMLNDDVTTTVVKRNPGPENDYTAAITESGDRREVPWNDLDYSLNDSNGVEKWVADPARKPGDRIAGRIFDFDRLEVRNVDITVVEASEWTAPDGGKVPVWVVEQFDPRENSTIRVLAGRNDGIMRESTLMELFTMRHEPEATARTPTRAPDIIARSLVPCDRPLGAVYGLRSLEIEITGKTLPDLPATSLQAVERLEDGGLVVRIGEEFGKPVPAPPEEIAENLTSTAQLPIDLPAVKELAARATAGATTPDEKVRRLLDFVSTYVEDGPTETYSLTTLLKTRRGDCTEHALLFNALARASGIPCREVTGWIYCGDESQAFGGHSWNEVVLDGHWVPVDPTWNERTPNASHVHLSSGELRHSDWTWLSGGLKIRVLSEKR